MLIHYRCARCGAALAARDDYEGQFLPCALCRHQNEVPRVERAVTRAELQSVTAEVAHREFSAFFARQSDEEARQIARAQAQHGSARAKRGAGVVILFGAVPCLLALVALAMPSHFGFSYPSLLLSLAFGVVAMIIGLSLRESAHAAEETEFQHLMPAIADRLRQEHWRQWESQHHASQPDTLPAGAPQ